MKKSITLAACAVTIAMIAAAAPNPTYPSVRLRSAAQTGISNKLAGPSKNHIKVMPTLRARQQSSRNSVQAIYHGIVPPVNNVMAPKVPFRAEVTGNFPKIRGCVISTNDRNDFYSAQFCDIFGDGTVAPVSTLPYTVNSNGGGFYLDGAYYATKYEMSYGYMSADVSIYEVSSGNFISYFSLTDSDLDKIGIGGTVVDENADKIYGITFTPDGAGMQLSTLEYGSNCVFSTPIANLEGRWMALSIDAAGQLYGIKVDGRVETADDGIGGTTEEFITESSALYKINKLTGEVTKIGATGKTPQYLSSATIDKESGRMFWNVCPADGTSEMCEVDLSSGVATTLFSMGQNEEITGMYVDTPEAVGTAPGAPESLFVYFNGEDLTGNFSFSMPTALYDGSPADGSVNYTVLLNGTVYTTGTAQYGEFVYFDITVPSSGNYKISVYLTNEAGHGPKRSTIAYAGYGIPIPVTSALLSREGDVMTISWDAVSGVLNYCGAMGEITYTVTRNDGTIIADGIAETTCTDIIAEPAEPRIVCYEIVATNTDVMSTPSSTNSIMLGAFTPPYENSFESKKDFEGFNTADANGDNSSWTQSDGAYRISGNFFYAMDDWIFTPAFKLERGKFYAATINVKSLEESSLEKIEVWYGTEPTIEAMNNILIPTTVINGENGIDLKEYLKPEVDGKYYIGIHGISDAQSSGMTVGNISIGGAVDGEAPDKPANLTVTSEYENPMTAKISFDAPTKGIAGNVLRAISEIRILRNGEIIETIKGPAPGTSMNVDDTVDRSGSYIYSVIAINSYGEGLQATASAFVGVDIPAAPKWVEIAENENEGEITLTWEKVTLDVNGKEINPEYVSYIICTRGEEGWMPIREDVKESSISFQAVESGQCFVQYAVFPKSDYGIGSGNLSDMLPAGTPYFTEHESFDEGNTHFILATGFSRGAVYWHLCNDETFNDLVASDGDNGYFMMVGENQTDTGSMLTGKISLKGCSKPGISFYTYNIPDGDTNQINVYVRRPEDKEWDKLGNYTVKDLGEEAKWHKISIALDKYAEETIIVRIEAVVGKYRYTMFDNIVIGNLIDNDVALTEISAPEKAVPANDFEIKVSVINTGNKIAENLSVVLTADGEEIDKILIDNPMAPGEVTNVSFTSSLKPIATDAVIYCAKVEYANDEATENNVSESVSVMPIPSDLPGVRNLRGCLENGYALIEWDEPEISSDLKLLGYEVYRNGEKINIATVEECSFVDAEPDKIDNRYIVLALYETGYSAPGSPLVLSEAGLHAINTSPAVKVIGRRIVISNALGRHVTICLVDGKTVYNAVLDSNAASVSVLPGFYVVNTGITATKVHVY